MKTKLLALLPVLVLLAACYPQGPDYVEDIDVVATTYDDEFNFDAKTTYAMPDKIVVDIDIEEGDTIYEYMKDAFATPILQAIQTNMTSRGFTRVAVSANPDLLLTPAGLSSTTYFYSYWYDWWYGGYWGWGWGWYYPPYYTVSSYTTGSMVMVLSDPKAGANSPINRSPAVWIGVGNGLFTGAYELSRVTNAINQAFQQSPYLKTN
jgi:predicted small lipoprotein YifL